MEDSVGTVFFKVVYLDRDIIFVGIFQFVLQVHQNRLGHQELLARRNKTGGKGV